MPRKNTAAAASSATTVPSSATTVPSSATTIPSSATTATSSSWSSIQSPPSTLTPIVSRQPGSPLSPSDRASYIDTIRYLQSENSRLKREVQITQKTVTRAVTREMSNIEAGYSVVIYNKRKRLDETDTERVLLELNIKRLRNDNKHLKSKLEKKIKNWQIAERNAVIHEKCSSDLNLNRIKERVDFAEAIISRVLCVSWKSPGKRSIFLPQMAVYMQTQRGLDFTDIIHQA
ncbi:lamin Dm0-like [Formica exsecta]|uniref:lamin Dm0-like n=1 Tax=Formica exsecta TaxID=72781 RepID=UPI0011437417|nr:lamin Dm0-like [Formica exsecta]